MISSGRPVMFPAISALDALGLGAGAGKRARARGGAALCCGVASAASGRLPAASPLTPFAIAIGQQGYRDE
jgi:hypothetical protein